MASLADLAKQQGDGWSVTGDPAPKLDNQGLPVPGVYTVALSGPGGAQRIATIYAPAPPGPSQFPNLIESDPQKADFTPMGVEETVKAGKTAAETNAEIARATADAERARTDATTAQATLEQIRTDNKNRDANAASGGFWVTDKERADITARAADQGLTQQQINNQLSTASDNNRVAQRQNEISALNAATTAFVAKSNAEANEARTRHEQGQLDETVAQNTWTRSQSEISNRLAQDKLALDQLTQGQANQLAQQTLAQRTQESQQTLAQRSEEAQQTAASQALGQGATAAASVYGAERTAQQQAAQTGANILQNRAATFQNLSQAPFTQAANLSQGSAGRYGMLGGGLHAVPEGAVSNILQGAYGTSTALYGGQNTLQAAHQAIENIRPGASLTPHGQAALGVLSQMFERTQQLLGNQRAGAGSITAPTTAPAQQPQAATPFAAPQTAAPTANSPFGAIGNNPMLAAMQAQNRAQASQQTAAATAQAATPFGAIGANPMAAAQGFQSPAPTIVINA